MHLLRSQTLLVQISSPFLVTLYDISSCQELMHYKGSESHQIANQVSISLDESFLLCTSVPDQKTVSVFSLLPPRPSSDFGKKTRFRKVRVSPSGRFLVTIDETNFLAVWSLRTFAKRFERNHNTRSFHQWSKDESLLVVCDFLSKRVEVLARDPDTD